MNNKKILVGIDAGHVNTNAVLMRGDKILSYTTVPTGFNVPNAAQKALNYTLESSGISSSEIDGIVSTGIFKDLVNVPPFKITGTVSEYDADAKGGFFLNNNSRTLIDIGGNIQKAIRYDQKGKLLDAIENDKCCDGLGIFYTTMSKALGVSEQGLSELALKSTKKVSVAIHCALSAESEAIDLMCQGVDITDAADAIHRFIVERVAAMCNTMDLEQEILVAGGMARSEALIKCLQNTLKQNVKALTLPEYVGAIGAVVTCGGENNE